MSIPPKPELTARLTGELGYPPSGAQLMADKIERLHPELHDPFNAWWDTGELPDIEVEGYTAARLVNERSLNLLAALLTLDWLLREPEVAKAAIDRGHDCVKTRGE